MIMYYYLCNIKYKYNIIQHHTTSIMIYSNRRYPLHLFNSFDATVSKHRGHLVIYKHNKTRHIGRLMPFAKQGTCIVQTLWQVSETIERIPVSSITHISALPYL
jgi:hypothetical protein